MPGAVMPAASFAKSGSESVDELNNDSELKSRIESLRLDAGARMGLGDVQRKVIPKMCLTAPPRHGGAVTTRTFTPHDCHTSIGVFGAVSVATACVLSSTVAAEIACDPPGNDILLSVEHPTGEFTVHLELADGSVKRAGLVRTARKLFDGQVFPKEEL